MQNKKITIYEIAENRTIMEDDFRPFITENFQSVVTIQFLHFILKQMKAQKAKRSRFRLGMGCD